MVMKQLREFFHGNAETPSESDSQTTAAAAESPPSNPNPTTAQPPTIPEDFTPPQPPADGIQTPQAPSAPPPGTPAAQDILTLDKIRQMNARQINEQWDDVSKVLDAQDETRRQ